MKNRYIFFFLLLCCWLPAFPQGTWTWMHGASAPNPTGNFGTIGVAAPANDPPGLYGPASFTDLQGNFWIFDGIDAPLTNSYNALWKFDPVANMWTWMKGSSAFNQPGVYGVQGVPAPANNPGARAFGAACWVDQQGNFWLYGGAGYDSNGNWGRLSDLWKYDPLTNEWTWMKGPTTNNVPASFGVQQVQAAANNPPAANEITANWVDGAGNLWFYGGIVTGNGVSIMGDMWRYNIAANAWTWMKGTGNVNSPASYGIQNIPAAANEPGSRLAYTHWTDANGNFWYYAGGDSITTNTAQGAFDDFWKYDPVTNEWTWMSGNMNYSDSGNYLQQCIPGSRPGERWENRACWTDDCMRFWFFGGAGSAGVRNDLWVFDPYTNLYTLAGGSSLANQPGNFGVMTVAAATNQPPGSNGAVSFKDLQGNLWMFGGYANLQTIYSVGNDLWRYTIDPNCPAPQFPNMSILDTALSYCVPATVSFVSSQVATGYAWDFGDPATASDTSGNHATSWTYTNPGTYTVTLIISDSTVCRQITDTLTTIVQVNGGTAPDIGADTLICGTPSLQLDAGAASAYQWSTGATTQTIQVTSPGTYWVMTDLSSCIYGDTIAVAAFLPPDLGPDQKLCGGLQLLLNPGTGNNYLWSTGDTTRTIVVAAEGTYWVQISNGNCVLSDTLQTTNGTAGILYVPNTFTPNGNGLNDEFKAYGEGITAFHLLIFDRWGNLLFESEDLNRGWDGRFKGNLCQEDVYVYRITYTSECTDKQEMEKIGHVNLIR